MQRGGYSKKNKKKPLGSKTPSKPPPRAGFQKQKKGQRFSFFTRPQ